MSSNFEKPSFSKEKSPKEEFIEALNQELSVMEQSGKISAEQAEEKRKAGSLIEEGFSKNPKQDAILFSKMGIEGEKEILDVLNKKSPEEDEEERE